LFANRSASGLRHPNHPTTDRTLAAAAAQALIVARLSTVVRARLFISLRDINLGKNM
jgi:hypothetical protein